MSQFKADIDLMVSNAKKYNMKGSEVYEDAVLIQVPFLYLMLYIKLTLYVYIEICKKLD